jgi:SAM-dependent methyltransferase
LKIDSFGIAGANPLKSRKRYLYNEVITTMRNEAHEYSTWRCIEYEPTLPELPADSLVPYLHRGQRALEIGCNSGRMAVWLASHGLEVLGIDINAGAILQARTAVKVSNATACFIEGDFLDQTDLGRFDLVLMVRVLTCFSQLKHWHALLSHSLSCVAADGLIYIHDFIFSPENDSYRERYAEGARRGWRAGNIAVPGRDGSVMFIAHHHTMEEISEITNPYKRVFLNTHDSLSINGNVCRMFEFLGKRPAMPAATS